MSTTVLLPINECPSGGIRLYLHYPYFMTKIFDFHIHCGIAHNTKYSAKQTADLFKNKNLQGFLCSSLSGIFDRKTAEKDLKALLKKDSRIKAAYWVNPYLPKWQLYADDFCRKNNIAAIKLSPSANIYIPDENFMRPVFDFCAQTKKFIVIHTDAQRGNPLAYGGLIKQYPKVPVVLYHLSAGLINIHLARTYKNVFLETSFCERSAGLIPLKTAYKLLGDERLLFGTDYPLCGGHTNGAFYDDLIKIYSSVLTAGSLEKVFYSNAKNLLKDYGVL